MRADVVLLVALSFAGGAAFAVSPAPSLLALLGVLWIVRKSLRWPAVAAVLLSFGAGA